MAVYDSWMAVFDSFKAFVLLSVITAPVTASKMNWTAVSGGGVKSFIVLVPEFHPGAAGPAHRG